MRHVRQSVRFHLTPVDVPLSMRGLFTRHFSIANCLALVQYQLTLNLQCTPRINIYSGFLQLSGCHHRLLDFQISTVPLKKQVSKTSNSKYSLHVIMKIQLCVLLRLFFCFIFIQ